DQLTSRGFRVRELRHVHRTTDLGLHQIFTGVRERVLDRSMPTARRSNAVRSEIQRLASAHIHSAKDLNLGDLPEGSLVLFRHRFDVLQASSYNARIPHRLRMSGLPPRLYPWIARLLWDKTDRRLRRSEFDS